MACGLKLDNYTLVDVQDGAVVRKHTPESHQWSRRAFLSKAAFFRVRPVPVSYKRFLACLGSEFFSQRV